MLTAEKMDTLKTSLTPELYDHVVAFIINMFNGDDEDALAQAINNARDLGSDADSIVNWADLESLPFSEILD